MAYLKRLYLKKFSFLLILIQLSSHVLQGRERGTQPTPASQMGTGWDQATWPSHSGFYGAGMSGLLGSPSSFNLSDYVDTSTQPNTQLNSGTRTTAAAATGSAAQLHAQLQQQTETDSARDDAMEPEPGP